MFITSKEGKLAAALLERASDTFSNHGCNDMDRSIIAAAGFTDEEKVQFMREYHEWSGDLHEFPNIEPEDFDYMQDWCVMDFLAHKLKKA